MSYAAVSVALTTALWDAVARRALPRAGCRCGPGRGRPAGARHHPVDHVAGRAQWRHPARRRAAHRAGARAAPGDRLRRRAGRQRRLPRLERCPARAGRGHLGCRAGDGVRGRSRLRGGRARRARPGRGPLPRRVPPAEAAGRRAVPAGDPAGVRRLRRGRRASGARRRGRALRAPRRGAGGGQRVGVGPGRRARGAGPWSPTTPSRTSRPAIDTLEPDRHRRRARPHPPALRRVAAPPQAPARRPRAAARRPGPLRAQRRTGLRRASPQRADRDRAQGRVGRRAAEPRA